MASPEPQQDSMDNEEPLKTKLGPVSFGFSKTISKVKTEKSERREFLSGIDGKELIGLPGSTKPVDKPKEFIIPLIQNSRSYRDDGVKTEAVKEAPSEQLDSVESQAIKELIEESQKQQERWHNDSHCDPNLVIPLILNQMSKGFEDGEHTKMELPDQQQQEASAEADYEQVPVKAYGLALMKGMGWKQEEGVGCKLKALTEAKEHQYRAKGLGLGADRTAIQEVKPSRPLKPGEEREPIDEGLVLGPGGCVLFQTGPHKDLYGKIEAVDPDNVRVQVKLAIGGVSVTASQHVVRLVPRKEYNRYCNDLSRLSKAHKEKVRECEKEKEQEKGRGCDQSRRTENANGKEEKGREKERQNNQEHDQRKRKNREADTDREKPQSVKESRSSLSSWIQRDLRVRFIDKTFKGGKYYNFKMRIEDVLAPYICVCRTDAGQLLDDIKQMMLETIVPKGDADYIMVVLGEHRGQVGRILKRDKERCRAMVQLERYEEKVFILDYDSICHYVGDH